SACGDLKTCQGGADVGFDGDPETLTVSNLPPGTYYFGIDSAFPIGDVSADGPYLPCGDGNLRKHADSDPDTDEYGHSDEYRHAHRHPHRDGHNAPDPNGNGNRDADDHSDRDAEPDRNDPDPDDYADVHADSDR